MDLTLITQGLQILKDTRIYMGRWEQDEKSLIYVANIILETEFVHTIYCINRDAVKSFWFQISQFVDFEGFFPKCRKMVSFGPKSHCVKLLQKLVSNIFKPPLS